MKALLVLIIGVFILPNFIFAKDDKAGAVEKAPAKRLYTEEEFQKAVLEDVENYLKKAGNNKLVDFSKELIKKDQMLKLREMEIDKKEQELVHNQEGFKNQIIKFQKKQERFLGCIDEKEQEKNKRITHMVDVVSGMKPQNAAEILSVQDSGISVQILEKLDPSKVSKIFNLMDKEISARLQKQFMNMKK